MTMTPTRFLCRHGAGWPQWQQSYDLRTELFQDTHANYYHYWTPLIEKAIKIERLK